MFLRTKKLSKWHWLPHHKFAFKWESE
jgi:hypothetical protein